MTETKTSLKSFFSSLKLTVFLLVLIALLFVLGTFLPQREGAMEFAQRLSPALSGLFQILGFFDVYHSPLYYALLGLLAVNLIVCSLNRLSGSWKLYRAPNFPVPDGLFGKVSPDRILLSDKNSESCLSSLESLLKEKFGKIEKNVKDHHTFFALQKGGVSLFSVYAIHMSILFLIAGAIIGSVFGFEGYVNISEGETTNAVFSRGGRDIQRLDFSVRCDKFLLETYENGMPKTYRSDLSFIRDGRVIRQASLLVNHPVQINGFRFYQSSYGSSPDSRAFLSYSTGKGQEKKMAVAAGDSFSLPGSDADVKVLRVAENLMQFGPGVKLDITSPQGRRVQFWVLQHIDEISRMYPELLTQVPLFNPALFKPYRFFLQGIEQRYYTGLQVVRDPGIPMIGLGAFLMVAGLILRYFIPHRRIWIRVDKAGKQTRISLAGRSRHQGGLDRELDLLIRRIREKGIV
ncbi:cytochrome c biogenesis protein [Syntrophus gentianae]|uniref:Cytochrome c biogenesis protein n=1 Tax=Syntrophus gentianae TaxID=43775 RepID=A0A1H7XTB0_9BACT|nr:cytochrome c biogenesis protein ResB [Syntrophus gentianae]SEM36971.1 cytochrome c biogenesis protein [Syntrophus gentianae]